MLKIFFKCLWKKKSLTLQPWLTFVCKIINTEVRKSTFGKKVVREALLAAYECMITVL